MGNGLELKKQNGGGRYITRNSQMHTPITYLVFLGSEIKAVTIDS
jgi:hypothetical protein